MEKFKRNERISYIMSVLNQKPNHVFSYNYFSELFNAAKSTISEDIMILKKSVSKLNVGEIQTIAGASGGVKLILSMKNTEVIDTLNEISDKLSDENRLIPGGFIYMADLLYDPDIAYRAGKIFADKFYDENIDYVVTVEMKGIPLALMSAKLLNVPLVIIRNNTKVTEGATVSINYVTGSTKKINTMSLSRKAMKENSRVLVIDDFMKAGGTAKGIIDMMKEFKSEVVSTGVLISTKEPQMKMVNDYFSLLTLEEIDVDNNIISIKPNEKFISIL